MTDPRPLVVLGPPGLTRDVVTHTLLRAGGTVVDRIPASLEACAAVVVLAEPGEEEWAAVAGVDLPVVVVVESADDELVVALLVRGAGAVVTLASPPEQLLEAVEVVAAGGTVLPPGPASTAVRHLRDTGPIPSSKALTPRERQILASIVRGESVKQTARALGISAKTVQNIQVGLYTKLQVRNRAQAAAKAIENGLL